MNNGETQLFQPGMHQQLTEACRNASSFTMPLEAVASYQIGGHTSEPIVTFNADGTIIVAQPDKIDESAKKFLEAVQHLLQGGFVVRKKGVSTFLQVRVNEIEWTQNVEHATRFTRESDARLAAASISEEVVPFSMAMVFAPPPQFDSYVVTLTKLDQKNRAGVFVSRTRVEELLPRLNARGLHSEYGQPMHFPAMGGDEWKQRLMTIEIDHVCCRLTQFRIEQIDGDWCLTAAATPAGYFRDAFMAMMSQKPTQGRFGLRCVTDDKYIDGIVHRELRNIITFDFIDKTDQ